MFSSKEDVCWSIRKLTEGRTFLKEPSGHFSWIGFKSRIEPLRGSLLFTTKFPEIPGTHFIDLRRMKG